MSLDKAIRCHACEAAATGVRLDLGQSIGILPGCDSHREDYGSPRKLRIGLLGLADAYMRRGDERKGVAEVHRQFTQQKTDEGDQAAAASAAFQVMTANQEALAAFTVADALAMCAFAIAKLETKEGE